MKAQTSVLALLAVGMIASPAVSGGVERALPSAALLFEPGNRIELSFGQFNPNVSGVTQVAIPPFDAGVSSGDMMGARETFALGVKRTLAEGLEMAVIVDQPIGADVSYPGTGYPLASTTARLRAQAVTGLVRKALPNNLSLIGGLRAQKVDGKVSIPFVLGYTLETSRDTGFGYVLGMGWERPEIAARAVLTYYSAITHKFASDEGGALAQTGSFETEIPQSLNLEFQTGIAADTLLFGSVRWVEWTAFKIDPPGYPPTDPLVAYGSDRVSYTLGLGRKLNAQLSAAMTLGYEPADDKVTGNLGPTDGYSSIGAALNYTQDQVTVTAGVSYVDIGDATTNIGSAFQNNSGVGVGLKIGYSY